MRNLVRAVEDWLAALLSRRISARLIEDHPFEPRPDGWNGACNFVTHDDGAWNQHRCNKQKGAHTR